MSGWSIKKLIEPWILIVGALAAIFTAIEQGRRIWKDVTAPPPPQAAMRLDGQRPFFTARPSEELLKVPNIRGVQSVEKIVAQMLIDSPPITGEVALWPIRLLVLNPSKDELTLHSCKVFAEGPNPFVSGSVAYFLGNALEKLQAANVDPFIEVEPDSARRADVMFVFPRTFTFGFFGKDVSYKESAKAINELLKGGLTRANLRCEDQAGRTFSASAALTFSPPRQSKK